MEPGGVTLSLSEVWVSVTLVDLAHPAAGPMLNVPVGAWSSWSATEMRPVAVSEPAPLVTVNVTV